MYSRVRDMVGDGGIIVVSLREGDKLYFDNSPEIVDNYTELALYSLETVTHAVGVEKHQPVGIKCSVLNTVSCDGVLRHFFIPAGKSYNTTHFNKLYFKPVRGGWGSAQRIYFESTNKLVILNHIVLLRRR